MVSKAAFVTAAAAGAPLVFLAFALASACGAGDGAKSSLPAGGSASAGGNTGGAGGTTASAGGSTSGGNAGGAALEPKAGAGGASGAANAGTFGNKGGAAGGGTGGANEAGTANAAGTAGIAGSSGGAGTPGSMNGGSAGTAGAGSEAGHAGDSGSCVPATASDGDVVVSVDAATTFQVFEGWGTSLCWFGNVIGGFEDENRNAVADRLFDPVEGLGLNVVRYNIGGGDAPGHDHMGAGKEMPGFKASASSDYDWNADADQRWMLDAARSRIPAEQFIAEAFSNSPPYWMTVSGCASGATDAGNNLMSDQYDDFADYLSDVVLHFKNTRGVEFRTLEPFNEPASDFWKANGAQEGCGFDRTSQSQLIGLVRSSLDERGLTSVGIAASDETSIDVAIDSYNALSTTARGQIVQINTHAYSGAKRAELRALATRDGKRLWSSEIDGSGAPAPFDVFAHNHTDIAPALDLAQRITRDLKELHSHAWIFWQAVENEQAQTSLNKNWGLLHADFSGGDQSHAVTKKYSAFAQYTRAIRPGYRQLEAGHADAVAFFGAGSLVIVQRNASQTDAMYGYDLSSFGSVGAYATVRRTSTNEDYAGLPSICVAEKRLVAPIKARSITTFVIAGVAP
jgi:O-glycosyl hydrolase